MLSVIKLISHNVGYFIKKEKKTIVILKHSINEADRAQPRHMMVDKDSDTEENYHIHLLAVGCIR